MREAGASPVTRGARAEKRRPVASFLTGSYHAQYKYTCTALLASASCA